MGNKRSRGCRGRRSSDLSLVGRTVELQTDETLFKGVVIHYQKIGDVFTLKNAVDVTDNLKIPGNCVISGVKMKRVLPIEEKTKPACRPRGRSQSVAGVSEHEESCNDRASEAADNIEQTFEDKPMVIPENVVEQRSSALFRNLRGRKFEPDQQPRHLSRLRTRLPPSGICELMRDHSLGDKNIRKQPSGVFSCGGGAMEEDSPINAAPESRRVSSESENSTQESIGSIIHVTNQFELVQACSKLAGQSVVGFSLQGDLRKIPARVSLICFSTPETTVLIDFLSCGASYGFIRDCFQELLESRNVLKVCLECGIVHEVLRDSFSINIANVFDPQVVDGYLAAGFDLDNVVPDQYYGLRTLLRYYLPLQFESFPNYCFKSESDYSGWLDRPLAANYWKVAEAETKHLVPLYKVQQDRINAKCALLINTRLTQFQKHKGAFPVCMPCKVDPEMLQDERELARKFTDPKCARANAPKGLNLPLFSKNINHHQHQIDLTLNG